MNYNIAYINYGCHYASSYYPLHKHNCYEIVYYIKGDGTTKIDSLTHSFVPGSFAVILPSATHDQTNINAIKQLYIGFTYDSPSIELKNGVFYDNATKNVLKFLEKIKNELINKDAFYVKKIELVLNELLIEIKRVENSNNHKLDKINSIINFIDENYNQKINMAVLSQISGYSYHRFRHIFKDKTGLSPINYIIEKKIEHSKKLILNTDLSMASIAQECGFSNSSQFTTLFNKNTGLNPIKFRKLYS
jgi:AraC family transcriptional activator of pobA